jgi:hypothetical protein
MTRPRPRLPRWLTAVVLLAAVLASVPAAGQATPFRITHTLDKGTQPQVTITGRVFNDARTDALDVYVSADALDGAGKIVASGVSYVGTVPSGNSTAFVIKVPSARNAASFRVIVTSFKFGFANQS